MSSGMFRRASCFLTVSLCTFLLVLLPAGCKKREEVPKAAQAVARIAAIPADHQVASPAGLVATDLEHGAGTARLLVQRSWGGADTLNTHFGPGWSDVNSVRLRLVDPDTLIIWRGGTGWRIAHRQGSAFSVSAGGDIQKTGSGWTARLPGARVWTFDARGRLVSEQPAAGPPHVYSYDDRDRLVSVGTGPENSLRYHYDSAGKRVSRIDGPEGLRRHRRTTCCCSPTSRRNSTTRGG